MSKKRMLTAALAACLMLSAVSCGGNGEGESNTTAENSGGGVLQAPVRIPGACGMPIRPMRRR